MKKRLYILGAGISRCMGIPIINDKFLDTILYRFEESVKKAYEEKSNEYRVRMDLLTSVKKEIEKSKCKDFDEVNSFLEKENKSEGLNQIYFWYFWDQRNNSINKDYYLTFINNIVNPKTDIVISFNYDLMLEKTMNALGKSYTYNPKNIDENIFKLLKPMGAVNLIQCEPNAEYSIKGQKERFFADNLFRLVFFDKELIKATRINERIYEINKYFEVFENKPQKFLFRPSVYSDETFLSEYYWDYIKNFILYEDIDEIVVIGYSFVSNDKKSRKISSKMKEFHKMILSDKRTRVVNPEIDIGVVSKMYGADFGGELNNISFEKWIENKRETGVGL